MLSYIQPLDTKYRKNENGLFNLVYFYYHYYYLNKQFFFNLIFIEFYLLFIRSLDPIKHIYFVFSTYFADDKQNK